MWATSQNRKKKVRVTSILVKKTNPQLPHENPTALWLSLDDLNETINELNSTSFADP
jgi:hypothetical protein